MSGSSRREESFAANGARWMAVAMIGVGLFNYGYAVLLTHLLTVDAYSTFAAGQGLILWASTVAIVSVPWVLAQALVRAQSDAERNAAVRFAKLVSAASGLVAAVIVGTIATRFAPAPTACALALSAFVLFLGTTTTGWLQGRERLQRLSVLTVTENVVKNGAGIVLVVVARLGATGALGAFGIGALVLLLSWPRTSRADSRSWLAALANRDLWRRAIAIAGAQGVVSLFVAVDVVMVALLPAHRALAASYQVSAAISRIPLYLAGAVAAAFFPSLSRRTSGGLIAARAVRMYAAMALPIAVILATVPPGVLAVLLPSQYSTVATLLKYTAVTGLAVGGITLVTAFFQAANDHSVFWWLTVGLVGYVCALLVGWRADGVTGLAVGGALGAAVSLALMACHLVRRQGRGVFALVSLMEPVGVAAVLVLLRAYPVPWLAAASLAGLRAAVRFVRPGARHVRGWRWASAVTRTGGEDGAAALLIDAVWRGRAPKATDAELRQALDLACRNRVEGRLARAYPAELANVLAETRAADRLFAFHAGQVTGCLRAAGIPAVMVSTGGPGDHAGASIDLLVLDQDLHRALSTLAAGYRHGSTHRLGTSATVMLYPAAGPEIRLHTSASKFGIPLSTGRLLSRASLNQGNLLVPAPADHLRIRLALALSQDLALDLAALLAIYPVLQPAVIADARAEARREGWLSDFDTALSIAGGAIDRMDRGLAVGVPVSLPLSAVLGGPAAQPLDADHAEQPNDSSQVAPAHIAAASVHDQPRQPVQTW